MTEPIADLVLAILNKVEAVQSEQAQIRKILSDMVRKDDLYNLVHHANLQDAEMLNHSRRIEQIETLILRHRVILTIVFIVLTFCFLKVI